MNKIIATLAAASMLLAANSPAFATDYGKNVRPFTGPAAGKIAPRGNGKGFGMGLAIGVGVGLVGAALAANSAQANQPTYRSYHSGYRPAAYPANGGMCRVWRADCRNGIESGCFKYERQC